MRLKSWVLCLSIVLVLLCASTVYGADRIAGGECGKNGNNLTWTLDSEGLLTISGKGDMEDYHDSNPPWYGYEDDVKKVVIENGVTNIGFKAFGYMSKITSVDIPNSVTTIESDAFYHCGDLTSISIPSSVGSIGYFAFNDCVELKNITFSKGLTFIGFSAFGGCDKLSSIVLPEGLKSISEKAFEYCENLTSITVPNSVATFGNNIVKGSANLKLIYYLGTEAEWESIRGYQYMTADNNATIIFAGKHPDMRGSVGNIVDDKDQRASWNYISSKHAFQINSHYINADKPVIISEYNNQGRMIGFHIADESSNSYDISTSAVSIAIFWLNKDFIPTCEAVKVDLE